MVSACLGLVLTVVLGTVYADNPVGYPELVARISRLEDKVYILEQTVSTLEKKDVTQQRLLSEQQLVIKRHETALRSAFTRNKIFNRNLSNRVQQLEKVIAMKTETKPNTLLEKAAHASRKLKPRISERSEGHPLFADVPARAPWIRKPSDNTKRLLMDTAADEGPVAFMARMDTTKVHIGINQSMLFENALLNIGNGYHPLQGIFIAPKAGIYIFSSSILTAYNNEHLDAEIVHNGNTVCRIFAGETTSPYEQGSQTALIHVLQGGEVWVRNMDQNIAVYGDGYSTFSGYLLWPM